MEQTAENADKAKQEIKAIKEEGTKPQKAPYTLPDPPMSLTSPEELQARLLKKAKTTKDKYRLGVIERTAVWIKNLVR